MRKSALVALAAVSLAAVSCTQHAVETRPTIQYVMDIMDGKLDSESAVLRANQSPLRSADITIIGSEKVCIRLADSFLECDARDNVDGRNVPDGLPDFAGESIACIADSSAYASYLERNGAEALRTQTVRRVLAALDTTVHISPYDVDGLSSKKSSKIVVLADPYLVQYGYFDVDTLFRSSSCGVKVVAPIDLMFDRVFDSFPDRKVNVAVVCDSCFVDSGLYQQRFRQKSAEHNASGSVLLPVAASSDSMLVRTILEKFIEIEPNSTLDAILVDDLDVDIESLKLQLADAISVMNESSIVFAKLISKGFFFIDTIDVVSTSCYDILRNDNLFTHNISKPESVIYRPVVRPDLADGSIMLIPGTYVQN